MAGVTEAQASVMRCRRSCNVGGGVAYTCPFMCPHKKKSNGVKLGERGGHSTKPPYPTTSYWNVSIRYCLTFETLRREAPSCYNHTFRSWCNGRFSTKSVITSCRSSKYRCPVNVPS
ncbi:hypothetical protein AVEN_261126-1 [Araneus ventricosus]|uniref:Uncharacterized protein n=1 Tax=Araneus ventricosus TaxID=182803 RepID=A0A4Y2DJ38_ARAVE|nr:hypothetical protein AVEN_261126-1 [Araneus ventricosus]